MRRRSTILVVDDDPNILKSLKRLFIDDSISMLVAANARQALSLLEN
ncbi:MAG: histidine kinase, partial [Candidatus Abyssubacteria bacterium]|nr:histidine kinase [Candidatus Abyssubacteria bacterium]